MVEVVLGVSLVATLSLAILGCIMQLDRMRRLDAEISLVQAAALNEMELLRATPFIDLVTFDGRAFDVPDFTGGNRALDAAPGDPDGRLGEVRVVPERADGEFTLYRVQVTIRWAGVAGVRQFVYQTLMSDRRLS